VTLPFCEIGGSQSPSALHFQRQQGRDRFGTVLTAQRCGIREIVMWDATVSDGKVRLATGELHPGSILLLHFGPDLARDLKAAVRAIRDAGLAPGRLADYLPTSTPEVS